MKFFRNSSVAVLFLYVFGTVQLVDAQTVISKYRWRSIRMQVLQNNASTITVVVEGAPTGCSAFYIPEGSRVVVDCPGGRARANKTLDIKKSKIVRKVRIGAHPDMFRVVLDLGLAKEPSIEGDRKKERFKLLFGKTPVKTEEPIVPSSPEIIRPSPIATISVTTNPTAPLVKASSTPTVTPTAARTSTPPPTATATPRPTATATEVPTATPNATTTARPTDLPEEQVIPPSNTSLKPAPTAEPGASKLQVDQRLVDFLVNDRGIRNIVVRNSSAKTIAIRSEVQEIVNPGTDSEVGEDSDKILVSPKRFALEPDSERTVRLVLHGDRSDEERLFRVRLNDEAGLIAAPQVEVLLRSKSGKPAMAWKKSAGKVVIENSGTASFSLQDGKCCSADKCYSLPGRRIYVGNIWTLKLTEDCNITYVKEVLGNFEQVSFDKTSSDVR